jgi:hypothetical protein
MIDRSRLTELLLYNPMNGNFHWRYSISGHIKQGKRAGTKDQKGYWSIRIDNKYYLQHRLAWFYVYNKWPDLEIDHINLKRHDNRIDNLREADHGQNQHNGKAYKTNKSGLKGVTYLKANRKWMAQIQRNKKHYYLGLYKTKEEASIAYKQAAQKFFGQFARSE